jgi:hypothetical protein
MALLNDIETNKKRIAAERARVNAMGTSALQKSQAEAGQIEKTMPSLLGPPKDQELKPATTPWPAVGPAMTNQEAMATAARVGTNIATPTGLFSTPLNTNANFSASAPAGLVETQQQRAAREAAQYAQGAAATRAMQSAAGQGMTHNAATARTRQLEQDAITQKQAELTSKTAIGVAHEQGLGLIGKEQAGIEKERVKGEAAAQIKADASGAQGVITKDEATGLHMVNGKPLAKDAEERATSHDELMDRISDAKNLAPGKENDTPSHWYNPSSWGNGPGQKWMYNRDTKHHELVDPNKEGKEDSGVYGKGYPKYLPLTPEERQAMTDAHSGGAASQVGGKRAVNQQPNPSLSAPPLPPIPYPGGLTNQPSPAVTSSTPGLLPAQPAAAAQSGTVTMLFPDGKRKQVPAADQQRYAAMGGKVQ